MTHARNWNVSNKVLLVKRLLQKYGTKTKGFFIFALLSGSLWFPAAHAGDANAQAIANANYLTNLLHGVAPTRLSYMVDQIAQNKIQRPAPSQPVWILNSIDGQILYYQGQPSFAGQPAAQLVDDRGIRFGQQAVDNARKSNSGWLTLVLGGETYRAFCQAKYPTVVCSLADKK